MDTIHKYPCKEYAPLWKKLAAHVGGKEGEELALSMLELYSVYRDTLPEWFASLYDPGVGGFYFCRSARDNERLDYKGILFGLLPDADSTWQALATMASAGMFRDYGNKASEAIPTEMQGEIIRFIKSLQDPNGSIYHPQFPRERNEEKITRRTRDAARGMAVLKYFGASPTYDSPTGERGDGVRFDGVRVALPSPAPKLDVGKAASDTAAAIPECFKGEECFRKHLSGLTLRNNSYSTGSFFITQQSIMQAIDKRLRADGASYTLYGILTDWLSENQLENGVWDDEVGYAAINGVMKICRLYSAAGVIMPRVERTVRAAITAICSDEPTTSIVEVFNPWVAVSVILSDLRGAGDDGLKIAKEVTRELWLIAPEAIRKTKKKLLRFLRSDGAFSYPADRSGGYNMGMPLGIAGLDEGDMNATHLALGIPSRIFSALGLAEFTVPIFCKEDLKRFLGTVDEKRKNI